MKSILFEVQDFLACCQRVCVMISYGKVREQFSAVALR